MIVKERLAHEHDDTGPIAIAGARAEAQMAHYLKRAFGDDPLVRVFHDLRLPDAAGGDAAQIDHLVLYRGGLVLIESNEIASTNLVLEIRTLCDSSRELRVVLALLK